MLQSPDGRLWLLGAEALSEVVLDAAQSPPSVREAGRWAWNRPRNDFRVARCDDAWRLWLRGNGLRFSCFELPPK